MTGLWAYLAVSVAVVIGTAVYLGRQNTEDGDVTLGLLAICAGLVWPGAVVASPFLALAWLLGRAARVGKRGRRK